MITFIIALLVLIGGYFLYGSYVEHLFSPDKNKKNTGSDYGGWRRLYSPSHLEDFHDSVS